nr:DNA (cytosine-5-)-methyltransferase [Pleionea sp. CnH1-48]
MKVLDLFSGIGGFALGLERAGLEIVGFCEVDEHAINVLKRHWPETPIYNDIRYLDVGMLKDVDVICGGFPCQDISKANTKGKGLHGTKSGLWFEFFRVIKEVKPKHVLIENSANLRHRGLATILKNLHDVGYDAEWHVIPSSAFGANHQRARLFIIAYPNTPRLQRPILNGDSLPISNKKEKPEFTSEGVSKWFAKWIQGLVISRDYAISQRMARSAIKHYGNSLDPHIAQFIGSELLKFNKEVTN